MGRPFKVYLSGPRIYSCSTCRAHAADHDDIISKVRPGPQSESALCMGRWSCFCGTSRGRQHLPRSARCSRSCSAACSNSKDATGGHISSIMCTPPSPPAMPCLHVICQVLDLSTSDVVATADVNCQRPPLPPKSRLCHALQGQYHARAQGGEAADHGTALRRRHPLHVLQHRHRLEICAPQALSVDGFIKPS